MSIWMTMDVCIFVRQECWIRLVWGIPLTSTPNMEIIYQAWGKLIYVGRFQLISGIQHCKYVFAWGRYMWMRGYVRDEWSLVSVCEESMLGSMLQLSGRQMRPIKRLGDPDITNFRSGWRPENLSMSDSVVIKIYIFSKFLCPTTKN